MPNGVYSARPRPRPGARNGLHSKCLTGSSTPTGTQQLGYSRRHSTQKGTTSMTEANGESAPTEAEMKKLLRKAEKGDTTVLPALRTWMDRTPGYWEAMGDLAKVAREALIAHASGGKNLLGRETITRKCAALTQELMGVTSSPIERLLVERIVMCWLQLYYAECIYVQSLEGSLTIRQAEFHQQRISKAQARYLAAIRTLAQVRRLGVPAVQINLAEQQGNVAGRA